MLVEKIHTYFPFLTWISSYTSKDLRKDGTAGVTVGVLLIPQGMAYAMIAGLPPVYGLYAATVPQVIYAMLGTSRQLSVGPVAMDSLLVAAGVSLLAEQGTSTYISFAILVAFFLGLFQVFLGIFKLGFITNLLARPVISGFTSAAAIIIGFNQLEHLLGIDIGRGNDFYNWIHGLPEKMSAINPLVPLVGFVGVLILVLIKRTERIRIPGSLLVVTVGIVFTYLLDLHKLGLDVIGEVPEGLPDFALPLFSLGQFQEVLPLSFTIAVVAFMESYSVSKALEAKHKNYRVLPNQELFALGAANMIGSLFQSYSVTGGFSRSAVNDQAGAKTPMASIIAAAVVGLTLLFLTPIFYYLPTTILAAIIIVAIAGLVDISYARALWQVSRPEALILFSTFLITLIFGMVPGIVSGVILSLLLVLYRLAYPHIAELGRLPGHYEFRNVHRFQGLEKWEELLILRIDAPMLFINAANIRDKIESLLIQRNRLTAVVIDASSANAIDSTALETIRLLTDTLSTKGVSLAFCGIIGPVRDSLKNAGILDQTQIFLDINEAVDFYIYGKGPKWANVATQAKKD